VAEIGESVAQISQRLALGAVGPEEAGQRGALDGIAMAKNEPGEEPVFLARVETRYPRAVKADLERPEKADDQGMRLRVRRLGSHCEEPSWSVSEESFFGR
jgi:hypothetical protein